VDLLVLAWCFSAFNPDSRLQTLDSRRDKYDDVFSPFVSLTLPFNVLVPGSFPSQHFSPELATL
jgi:hypothetical protein